MEIDLPSALRAHPCPHGEKIEEVISRPCVSDQGCRARGAVVLSKTAAQDAWVLRAVDLRPRRREARLGRKSGVGMAVRFAVGAKGTQHQKPPPGPPHPQPGHCFPAHDCPVIPGNSQLLFTACLLTIARHCAVMRSKIILPLSKCPRTVSRSRWASRRTPNEPMLRKENVLYCTNRGTFYIALTQ